MNGSGFIIISRILLVPADPLVKKNVGQTVDFLDMTLKMFLNVISSVPLHSLGGKILIGRLLKSSIHPIYGFLTLDKNNLPQA